MEASDLPRFDEWLTISGGWRSPLPEVIEQGTTVSSLIKIKGFRITIHWEVTDYDAPKQIEMRGKGFGGVRIALQMTITDNQQASTFHLLAELSGALLNGRVGDLVARLLHATSSGRWRTWLACIDGDCNLVAAEER